MRKFCVNAFLRSYLLDNLSHLHTKIFVFKKSHQLQISVKFFDIVQQITKVSANFQFSNSWQILSKRVTKVIACKILNCLRLKRLKMMRGRSALCIQVNSVEVAQNTWDKANTGQATNFKFLKISVSLFSWGHNS